MSRISQVSCKRKKRPPFQAAFVFGRSADQAPWRLSSTFHLPPKKDPDGRPSVIRYSRKTKEQYVQTEVDGKPTGWKAFYDGGKWKVEDKRQGA